MSIVVVFMGLLALGLPVAFVLLGAAIWFTVDYGHMGMLQAFPSSFYAGIESFDLLSIPLFVLLGEVMTVGGLTRQLFETGIKLLGRLPRKLAFIVLGANLFLAAILGSANAQVAVMTPAILPEMLKAGYRRSFAAALTSGAALLGPIVPPSMIFIVYAVVAQVSIGDMFLAGILPGLLLAGMIGIYIYFANAFVDGDDETPLQSGQTEERRHLVPILAAALVPLIIVGSILGGVATPTESAAIAVVVAIVVVNLFFDRIRMSDLPAMLVRASINTAIVLILIAAVRVFAFILTFYNIPDAASKLLVQISSGPVSFMLLIVALLLFIGAFMDGLAAIIVLVPILLPVATGEFGISPIAFGIVFCLTALLGVITPPVGTVLFIGSALSGVSVSTLSRELVPYMLAGLAVVLLVVFFPWLATAMIAR